jgi:hypothetical protein
MYKPYFTGEITLHVAQSVNSEQLQHCISYKYGFYQVHNCNTVHKVISRTMMMIIIINKDDDDDSDNNNKTRVIIII